MRVIYGPGVHQPGQGYPAIVTIEGAGGFETATVGWAPTVREARQMAYEYGVQLIDDDSEQRKETT